MVKLNQIAEAQLLCNRPVHMAALLTRTLTRTPLDKASDNGPRSRPIEASGIAATTCRTSRFRSRREQRLSDCQERALAERIKMGDTAAYQELILANLSLVLRAVGDFEKHGISRDDLIQEGNLALIRAARSFCPRLYPARFATYASFWIRASLLRSVVAHGSMIAVPRRLHSIKSRCSRAVDELERKSGANTEVIAQCHSDLADIAGRPEMPRHIYKPVELMRGSLVVHEATGDQLSTDILSPDRDIMNEERKGVLEQALRLLSPFEAWVIRERFGLGAQPTPSVDEAKGNKLSGGNHNGLVNTKQWCNPKPPRSLFHRSYVDLGRDCGLSTHRVRQVEQAALNKLRKLVVPMLGGAFLK
jgi:RNA polymerase sigma factor (sigma-70 family)